MLKNFFLVTVRNLWRNKSFTSINIIGLAIGMASALLIGLWVQHEISYDRWFAKSDRIYQLYTRGEYNGKPDAWPHVSSLMAGELKKDLGEVEEAARVRTVYFLVSNTGEKHFNLQGAFADSSFLRVFDFPVLKGDVQTALSRDEGIVLTEHVARNLFGDADPIGQTVRIDSTDNFKVTAVLKDLPGNTEFTFQYLLPWSYLHRIGWDNNGGSWKFTDAVTYVALKPGASEAVFDSKISHFVQQQTKDKDLREETFTQPLVRAHLYSRVENGRLTGGLISMVRMFSVIAVFILLIACINFMNLSTARSERRAREVGIRKVVGAARGSLIAQFIGESIVLAALSFVLSLFMVELSLKSFNQLIGADLHTNYADSSFWYFAAGFILFTGIVSGSYPAFYLSSFRPASVLKGSFQKMNALLTPRKVLVVLQFTFSIVLIICTIVVHRQVQYARNRDTGYNRDKLVFTFAQGDVLVHYDQIRQELIGSGAAISVTKLFSPITRIWGSVGGFSWPGSTETDKKINFAQFESDVDFVRTTGTQLVQGRDIDLKTYPTDSTAVLLNETAVKTMRLQDPVGKMIRNGQGVNCHVVGVLKDFIIESPYDPVEPMIIQGLSTTYPVVHFRLNPAGTVSANLKKAGEIFSRWNPRYPFEYYFTDEYYNSKFKSEQQQGILGLLFSGLTIFISCLGLFGLASYMAESRTREIGIRKVLGASVASVTLLMAKDFIGLVLIAVIIATPIAWYAMHSWLGGFKYRIQIGVWVFLMAAALSILIAVVSVAYQSIMAALVNPVRSLRRE
ncbi:MAG: ABC transporter permease [Sphingobacteriales bacterium 50-39]|nr:ABC transporter permease [Sphingobacteriales bacterium]OJW57829.1 MAG: ABC transporter permease [Sphingobacteriales bacterium 50-39]